MDTKYKNEGTIYQLSIMNALLEGIYEGDSTLKELAKHGDFGLGTFNQLDGELLAYNGEFYQMRADGSTELADENLKVPFGAITNFNPEISYDINTPIDKKALDKLIKTLVAGENLFYAIHIEGHFKNVKTRTVSIQHKPYRAFTEVVKDQAEFDFNDRDGFLVGFFSPAFSQGMTVAGYHLHFLSDDRKGGGHVLDFLLESGKLQLQVLADYRIILPEKADFQQANLSTDTSAAIIETEG